MLSPTAREVDEKQGPCGVTGSVRGDDFTIVRAGSTLRVTWRETINHPSHFRISFDADGDDDFGDPEGYDDRFSNDAVLIDGISDQAGGVFSADVVLPDIECDNCTLQLVQVMYDKKPYVKGTNDLYYRCADLKLTKSASEPPAPGTPTPPPSAEPVDQLDSGVPDETESDANPASGEEVPAPSSQPAPGSEPGDSAGDQGDPEAGASGYTCDALSTRGKPLHVSWPICLFLSALLIAQRARRRARLMLACAREPQAAREKR